MKSFFVGSALVGLACGVESQRTASRTDTVIAQSVKATSDTVANSGALVMSPEASAIDPSAPEEAHAPSVSTRPYKRNWSIGTPSSRFRGTGMRYADGRLLLFLD